VGTLRILEVQGLRLKNKERVGKSDPYFSIEYGDFQESSMTLNNAENEIVWSDVNMLIEVNEENLRTDRMRVCVHDENASCTDTVLGSGYANMCYSRCATVGVERKIDVDLVDEKGARCGSVVMTIVLEPSRVQVREIGYWVLYSCISACLSPYLLIHICHRTYSYMSPYLLIHICHRTYSYMSPYSILHVTVPTPTCHRTNSHISPYVQDARDSILDSAITVTEGALSVRGITAWDLQSVTLLGQQVP
jgi:hypothetical protein